MTTSSRPESWLVAVHAAATTVRPTRDEVIAFDLEGRPISWFVGGRTYKRSLASAVFGRRTVDGERRRWQADAATVRALFARAGEVARDAATALARGGLDVADPEALAERLARAAAWTPDRLAAESERFAAAYAPIPILPPDQYGAVVLQATFGCAWNRCTYCTFYLDRPFQVRDPAAFEAHVRAVRDLLGRAEAGRRSVFLADGNALVLSEARLRPIVDAARNAFPGRDVAGFVDVFGGERKDEAAWRRLREAGLTSVAIGAETGHDPLLAWLNKPGGANEAAAFVTTLKRAGLAVSVILMVGVGGRRWAEGHVRDTAALLGRLPLGRGDRVYLSPFVRHAESAYARAAREAGVEGLSAGELAAQERALRSAARAAVPEAQVARYSIAEFVY